MSINFPFNRKVNDLVNDLKAKRKYSEPKIYTGGVDVTQWNKLSKAEQAAALSKVWFVYYSYRHPETGNLEKLPFIKANANYYKTKAERMDVLSNIRDEYSAALASGYNPYLKTIAQDNDILTVKDAFAAALAIKKVVMSETSFQNFNGRMKRFLKWLKERGFENRYITSLDFKTVNTYLNEILQSSSAANRNNTRLDISALFGTMAKERMIPDNFVLHIAVLKSTPKRNKSYTSIQEDDLFAYMKSYDPELLLFVQFVSYNFLRPVEVVRLRVKDISIEDARLQVKTKTGYDEKIIPAILLEHLSLDDRSPEDLLFMCSGASQERDRRGYFGKRFAVVKKHFGLGADYTIYSFRHTFISKLYNELVKSMPQDNAEGTLMSITGHTTRDALRKYLRSIDAYRPEDYSKHLRK